MRSIIRIAKFVRKGKFDIVHIHCNFYFYLLAILLYHRQVKFCYTIHGDPSLENRLERKMKSAKYYCFRHSWVFPITISSALKAVYTKFFNCDIQLIHNGVKLIAETDSPSSETDRYRITNQTKVFIHAARICPEKNQIMLCRVFNRLIQEGADIVLLIAGPIHHRDIYEKMSFFFSNRIQYIGDRKDIFALLLSADGMCLPSCCEGFPMILLESIASGCIPVCTPVGGILDIIEDSVHGFLADDCTEESYYNAIKRFLDLNNKHKQQMKDSCFMRSKDFTIERCSEAYITYYQKIIANNA